MGTVVFLSAADLSFLLYHHKSSEHAAWGKQKQHPLPVSFCGCFYVCLLNSCCHIILSHESTNPAHVRKSNRADEFKRFSSRVAGC
jgi:hypothetical protein